MKCYLEWKWSIVLVLLCIIFLCGNFPTVSKLVMQALERETLMWLNCDGRYSLLVQIKADSLSLYKLKIFFVLKKRENVSFFRKNKGAVYRFRNRLKQITRCNIFIYSVNYVTAQLSPRNEQDHKISNISPMSNRRQTPTLDFWEVSM